MLIYIVAVFADPIIRSYIVTTTLAKANSSGDTGTMVKYTASILLVCWHEQMA